MKRLVDAYLRFMKYLLFLAFCGVMAFFIGPHHSFRIKAVMGFVVGAMILGRRLPDTTNEFSDAIDAYFDEIFFK